MLPVVRRRCSACRGYLLLKPWDKRRRCPPCDLAFRRTQTPVIAPPPSVDPTREARIEALAARAALGLPLFARGRTPPC